VTTLSPQNAPSLRKVGWVVEHSEDAHTKVIEWTLKHPEITRNPYPQYPRYPQNAGVAGVAGIKYTPSQDEHPSNGHRTCDACGEPITTYGETTHPNCDPEGTGA
jgi:hypothetical protein